ncbi:hypothetical protein KUTeg_008001 [Tegillarca granosa]|uniref:Uncharacterized protein n=1 Tax=Tegillarca granosa TaxID=220873 RepID=A0ABQ9FI50_TEGGR|nr:hypothetical protein KUTeg_008001 [Tegillarca granosa]
MAVVQAWNSQGGRDPALNLVLKQLFVFTQLNNIDLHVYYISTNQNPADKVSRGLSMQDVKFTAKFGPHSTDLMAVESNVMLDENFNPLKFFSPYPCKSSAGVNLFSQNISEEGVKECTIVVPEMFPRPGNIHNIPRIWRPADLCQVCGYPNDDGLSFCQACGRKKQIVDQEAPLIDTVTEKRLCYLDNILDSKSYVKQKSALEREFKSYLLERLRSIFLLKGRGKFWDESTCSGNPAYSLEVHRYLKAIQLEQAQAHVTQKQAKPLFVGKTLGTGKTNEFTVSRMQDNEICPVFALERYVQEASHLGVNLKTGYLFRNLDSSKKNSDFDPVSSNTMWDRLKKYLNILNLDGETPHGLRGVCAISLTLSWASSEDIMSHVGCKASYQRYSRYSRMVGSSQLMNSMISNDQNRPEIVCEMFGNVNSLPNAFDD